MKIALDIDGCISENPTFFSILSRNWNDDVYIISHRDDREKTIKELDGWGIKYKELILVNSFEEKAVVIKKLGIEVFFEDQPEMLIDVDQSTTVFLIRNEGNFEFEDKKWMFSSKTAKLLF